MKIKFLIICFLTLALLNSCSLFDDDDSIAGEQSPMGEVGATISSIDIDGVKDAVATVISSSDGISTFTGSAKITNPVILNVISNIPEFTVNGNDVTVTGLKFKVTKEGFESKNPSYPGVLVKYDSKVGDTYSAGSGYKRKVISKSTNDDYSFGFFNIKVMKVEESPSSIPGVKKLIYIANHRFGIVGIEVTFEDDSTMNFTTMGSAQNN